VEIEVWVVQREEVKRVVKKVEMVPQVGEVVIIVGKMVVGVGFQEGLMEEMDATEGFLGVLVVLLQAGRVVLVVIPG